MQTVVEEIQRVISHTEFRQFINGLISDGGPKFRVIVENSSDFMSTKTSISKKIMSDFEQLNQLVQKCEQYADVNKFDQTFQFEVFEAEHSDLESIKEWLEKLAKWDIKINQSIKATEQRGLIIAVGKKLKDKLIQRVKAEQTAMKTYLYRLANDKVKECNVQINEIKKKLSENLNNLSLYVAYVNELDACR